MSPKMTSLKVIYHKYTHNISRDSKKKTKNKLQSTSEDRWPTSGSSPGSDDVRYDYNLLRSMLPTAVQDNMFHPL